METICLSRVQKARTTRRSRYGCRNCKLRKLKCDERKPHCTRCSAFGVLCNYMSHVPDLQPLTESSVRPPASHERLELRHFTNAIWTSDRSISYQLDTKCQEFISRFLGRNHSCPDDSALATVHRGLFTLAFTRPFLMHAWLAVTFAYDRFLNSSMNGRRTLDECYHWSQGTTLFNKRLSEPIERKDMDAIWGTAVALATVTFASPDVDTPEESWPMKSSNHSALEWFCLSNGKMSLLRITNPLRPDSLFRVMAPTFAQMDTPLPAKGLDGVPKALAKVCNLTHSSTAQSNPYFDAVHAISQIQNLPDNQITVGLTEIFVRRIRGRFRTLLCTKDPVALLLLFLWYQKAGRSIWWIESRARIERPSICLYLQIYHIDYDTVHAFLPGGALAGCWSQLNS